MSSGYTPRMGTDSHPLLDTIATLLDASPTPWDDVLAAVTQHFDCPVGTVHLIDDADGMLHLKAQRGLPPLGGDAGHALADGDHLDLV